METAEDLDSLTLLKLSLPELQSTSPEKESMEGKFTLIILSLEKKERTKATEEASSKVETEGDTNKEVTEVEIDQIQISKERLLIFNKFDYIYFIFYIFFFLILFNFL